MVEIPAANFHADNIDVHMHEGGKIAMLTLVNSTQGVTVTLPRSALENLCRRIENLLAASTPPIHRQ
jgi:hypothetical protein